MQLHSDNMGSSFFGRRVTVMHNVDQLRGLADLLDLHFGVETRKLLLKGTEVLRLGTDETVWSLQLTQVAHRIDDELRAHPDTRFGHRGLVIKHAIEEITGHPSSR